MKYFPKLLGERLYLSPMSTEDAAQYAAWLNDLEVAENLTTATAVITVETEREVIVRLAKGHNYAIVLRDADRLIGNCSFVGIDEVHRVAEVGIFIGEKECWNRGYGREALTLLIDYGFDFLNLHAVYLRVFAFNERAIASYRRIGFREAGVLREQHFARGVYHDLLLMDVLCSEWKGARAEGAGPVDV